MIAGELRFVNTTFLDFQSFAEEVLAQCPGATFTLTHKARFPCVCDVEYVDEIGKIRDNGPNDKGANWLLERKTDGQELVSEQFVEQHW